MKYGFIKVAVGTPDIKPADCEFNSTSIIEMINQAEKNGAKILVLPQLCITGYTCGDLFLQDTLLKSAADSLIRIAESTIGMDILIAAGLPIETGGNLYNVTAVIQDGKILAFVPKTNIPDYAEFYETRYFSSGEDAPSDVEFLGGLIPMGNQIIFSCTDISNLVTAVEICEDLWVMHPQSNKHAKAGALIILNGSASGEIIGKAEYRRESIKNQSARLMCAYLYADAGEGESTTDMVFAGHNLIAENGSILIESELFKNELITTEIDLERLNAQRRKMTMFKQSSLGYRVIKYGLPSLKNKNVPGELPHTHLTRFINPMPFIPKDKEERKKTCNEIVMIQAMALKKRLFHTKSKTAVIGVSGGLDSTIALYVIKKTFELSGRNMEDIIAVTMPCFGTTNRTYQNAVTLVKELGLTLLEIDISASVKQHLKDISHDIEKHDVVYENAQARERTQVLMDLANKTKGIVIGTGDLSELALGFATYNGDHMSMYGVNASLTKTLIRCLIEYFAEETDNVKLREVLLDILDTPISPELFPSEIKTEGKSHLIKKEIVQKTEDIIGPYELHDFFLYYMLGFGHAPSKILYLAEYAFEGKYNKDIILKWMKVFYTRFFEQQYKRSCLPDGPKIGCISLAPRGDFRMPSDACVNMWMKELMNT